MAVGEKTMDATSNTARSERTTSLPRHASAAGRRTNRPGRDRRDPQRPTMDTGLPARTGALTFHRHNLHSQTPSPHRTLSHTHLARLTAPSLRSRRRRHERRMHPY